MSVKGSMESKEPAYCILYEDRDRAPEVFMGAGAAFFARQRYRQAKDNWNCHLMMEIFPDPLSTLMEGAKE